MRSLAPVDGRANSWNSWEEPQGSSGYSVVWFSSGQVTEPVVWAKGIASCGGERAGSTRGTVIRWLEVGLLKGRQLTSGAPWRIRVTAADRQHLTASDAPAGWLPLKGAALALGVSQQTVLQRLKCGELDGIRVCTGRASPVAYQCPGNRLTRIRRCCSIDQSQLFHEVTHYALQCPRCGRAMTILAFILEKEVIERILHHIGEDSTPPRILPTRSPPQLEMPFAQTAGPVTWPEMNQTTEFLDNL